MNGWKPEMAAAQRVRLGLIAAGVALALALPGSAPGATTVGQTGNTGSGCAGSGYTLLQDAVAGPPAYIAPTGGVITSWSHDAGPGTFAMRMKAYRPTADADQYIVVGQSAVEQPAPNALRTFSTRVTVAAGDVLGLSIVSGMGTSACLFVTAVAADHTRQAAGDQSVGSTISGPWNGASSRRVNVAALLEPDEDADGFGDETQDQCPTDASTQGTCPPDTAPPETTITKGAPKKTDKTKVQFKFTSSEPDSTFECKLDKKKFKTCESPRKVKRLDEGTHKFKVRAVDAAGNVDSTPAKDKFKVVD